MSFDFDVVKFVRECLHDPDKKRREQLNKSSLKYNRANRDKVMAQQKEYRALNPEVGLACGARYRARKLKASPEWLTKEHHADIQTMYSLAKKLERLCGVRYHVDHIVPLQGKNVCGLHVPWNLQILTARANVTKGNR